MTMIKYFMILIIFILFLQSCTSNKENSTNHIDDIKEMDIGMFHHVSTCVIRTKDFFSDWKKYGGKIQESVLKIRDHIKKDNESEFAILVKAAWNIQEQLGFFESSLNFGNWPISNHNQSIVFESYLLSDKNKLGECGGLAMWNELMSEYFSINKKGEMIPRLQEFPTDILWKYPDNMTWLKYWIFANVKNT